MLEQPAPVQRPPTFERARKNALVALAITAVVALVILILSPIIDLLALFFISILIALFLTSVSRWLCRHTPLSEKVALVLVLIVLLILLVLGVWLLVPTLVEQIQLLGDELPNSLVRIREAIQETELGQTLLDRVPTMTEMLPSANTFIGEVTAFFSSSFNVLFTLFIVVFIGIYLAAESNLYSENALRLVPPSRRERISTVMANVASTLRDWLISRGIAMLVVGTLTTVGLSIIGIPLALVLGVIAGILELIPTIGPILSVLPAVLITIPIGLDEALYVLILYLVIQQADSYLITPMIERRTVKLPPALTVAMQVLLATIVGPLGILLAAPLTAVGLVVVKMLYVEDMLDEPTDLSDEEDTV